MNTSLVPLALIALTFLPSQVPESIQRPMRDVELICLFDSAPYEKDVMKSLTRRGIDFEPDDNYLQMLARAGASEEFLKAVRSTRPINPPEATPVPRPGNQSVQSQVLEHIARAAQIRFSKVQPVDAETELRAALRLDPTNALILWDLGTLMSTLDQPDVAKSAYRYAARLAPDLSEARLWLARELITQGKLDEAENECRSVIRLEPDNESAHTQLESILEKKGDEHGAKEEKQMADTLRAEMGAPKRVRVGGQVMQAKLISQTKPAYPRDAKSAGIEGTVRMKVLIGKDGAVKDLVVLSGDPALVRAALGAVSTWHYPPTTVHGVPVEVITEVDVNFTLRR